MGHQLACIVIKGRIWPYSLGWGDLAMQWWHSELKMDMTTFITHLSLVYFLVLADPVRRCMVALQ